MLTINITADMVLMVNFIISNLEVPPARYLTWMGSCYLFLDVEALARSVGKTRMTAPVRGNSNACPGAAGTQPSSTGWRGKPWPCKLGSCTGLTHSKVDVKVESPGHLNHTDSPAQGSFFKIA